MAKEQGMPPGIVINRTGKYGVLKKVPKALWGHPRYKGKSKTIERSTRTADRTAGLKAAIRMLADLEAEFDAARDDLAAASRPRVVISMSDDEMDAFVEYCEIDMADVEHNQACFAGGDIPPAWQLPEPGDAVAWHAKPRRLILSPALEAMLKTRLAERLAETVQDVNFRSLRNELAMSEAPASHGIQPQRRRHTLAELIERFKADPGRGADLGNYAPIFPLLYDVLGEGKTVASVTHDDMERVRDVLMHLPPYATDPRRSSWERDRNPLADDAARTADRVHWAKDALDRAEAKALPKATKEAADNAAANASDLEKAKALRHAAEALLAGDPATVAAAERGAEVKDLVKEAKAWTPPTKAEAAAEVNEAVADLNHDSPGLRGFGRR